MTQALSVSQSDFQNLDAVEIKMTIADEYKSVIHDLLPDQLKPQESLVYFFDTPDLELFNKHQVILRARSKANKDDDSTIKLRRVDPSWSFPQWRETKGEFKVEGDWVGEQLIRSASLTVEQAEGKIQQVAAGKVNIDKLFSKDQEKFFAEVIHSDFDFSTLSVLGPAKVYKWKQKPPQIEEEFAFEYWQLENPQDVLQAKQEILELSVKVDCDRAQVMYEHFNQFLEQHGIDPGGKQQPKTRTTLDFFAGLI